MSRDEIERMARAAKGHAYTNRYTPGETAFAFSIDRLEHFAALVAAAEREECAKAARTAMLGAEWALTERVLRAIRARGQG